MVINGPSESMRRSTGWNAGAQLAPVVSAATALPFLARGLGEERLGILLLVWTIISLTSILDLGVGRAMTQMLAARRTSQPTSALSSIVMVGVGLSGFLGLAIGTLVIATSGWLTSAFPDTASWASEARVSVLLVGLTLPFLLLSNALRATLDGLERFELSARVRIPIGILTFLCPVALLPFTQRVDFAVASLLAVRLAGALALGLVVTRLFSSSTPRSYGIINPLKELLRLGSWVSVSNVVSTILVYSDRFFIASLISVSAVAHYTTASELITRLLLGPIAVATVWFPALARTGDIGHAQYLQLTEQGVRLVTVITFPVLILAVTFADPFLRLWVGSEIAVSGTPVLQWLALGVFMNALAQIPFTTLHARARPDAPALLHLLELPLYLGFLWWALPTFGVVGAAMAWTARATFDFISLLILATYVEPKFGLVVPAVARLAIEGVILLVLTVFLTGELDLMLGMLILAPLCAVWLWHRVLTSAWQAEIKVRTRGIFGL